MIAKISMFVICIEETIYLLLYSLYDCIFNGKLHFFLYSVTLRKNCPYSEFSCSACTRIRTEYGGYEVSFRIQSECAKIRTRKTLNTDTFHAVQVFIEHHWGLLLSLLLSFIPDFFQNVVLLQKLSSRSIFTQILVGI